VVVQTTVYRLYLVVPHPVVSSLDRACTCELSKQYIQSLVAERQPLSRGFCGPNHNGACSLRGKVEAGEPLLPDQEFRRVLSNAGCKGSAAGTMTNRSLFTSETGKSICRGLAATP
jgi:hypothetical protein